MFQDVCKEFMSTPYIACNVHYIPGADSGFSVGEKGKLKCYYINLRSWRDYYTGTLFFLADPRSRRTGGGAPLPKQYPGIIIPPATQAKCYKC